MALTPEDIELHKRTLRSLNAQADDIARRLQADERELRRVEYAIGTEEAILRGEGVEV